MSRNYPTWPSIFVLLVIGSLIGVLGRPYFQEPTPAPETKVKIVDMRRELQQFVITIRDCEYIAYWTYSYDQSLRLIHAADCPNRSGHVIVLSNGAATQFRNKR